jgi:uncharacterized caspase-like protein
MRSFVSLRFVCAALAGLLLIAPAAAQDKRVALVIGNSDYKHVFALPNPVNDAKDIGAALTCMGYTVTALTNASAAQMRSGLGTFAAEAKSADTALVFYAGHAIETEGDFLMIPVDGKVGSHEEAFRDGTRLDQLLERVAGSAKLSVVLLDTARNNPFAATMPGVTALRAQAVPAAGALFVNFATQAGATIPDGEGRNSHFTKALLNYIETPGLDLREFAARVRAEVLTATGGEQTPLGHAVRLGNGMVLSR